MLLIKFIFGFPKNTVYSRLSSLMMRKKYINEKKQIVQTTYMHIHMYIEM